MDPAEYRLVVREWADPVLGNQQAAHAMRLHVAAFPRQACYHAHLAAEQAVKTILVVRQIDPPKTHDLIRLSNLLPAVDQTTLPPIDWAELGRWAIEDRYPQSGASAHLKDADTALIAMEFRDHLDEGLSCQRRVLIVLASRSRTNTT